MRMYMVDSNSGRHLITFAQAVLAGSSHISNFFPERLFSDPGRDILLQLFIARASGVRVPASACAAGLPHSTTLRWLNHFEQQGIVVREGDQHDLRRVFVSLSDKAFEAMISYLTTFKSLILAKSDEQPA